MALQSPSIKEQALRLGFNAVGITRVEAASASDSLPARLLARLEDWLSRGFHGTMAWMVKDPGRRTSPHQVLPGCRSIISLGMNYYTEHVPDERPGNGRIARYAWGKDYHDILTPRLETLAKWVRDQEPSCRTRCYVDTGPVMEKAWAQQAGLGWIGKHANLVSPDFGSWLVLGEILTTLALDADEPGTDLCGSCSLCIRACPTGAITEPYVVDARKCLSYLTIEFRGGAEEIPEELRRNVGNHIFGCDDCLDACPYNVNETPTQEPGFQPSPVTVAPNLRTLAALDAEGFRTIFHKSPVRRTKLGGLLRNVRLALETGRAKEPVTPPAITGTSEKCR